MTKLIDINSYPVKDVLPILLKDKTTNKNIIFATDCYKSISEDYSKESEITLDSLYGTNPFYLQPRVTKSFDEQLERTREKGEVMTPVWLCNMMINYADQQWIVNQCKFNEETCENTWAVNYNKIQFIKGKSWKKYVDSRRLEISCGEAPYLTSRYNTTTGEIIEPLCRRVGILDRKLRIVNENTTDKESWLKWAERAVESSYGYEYQGDSLLLARINVLLTFYEYYTDKWNEKPALSVLRHISTLISWNLWQMDGLTKTIPLKEPEEDFHQVNIFEMFENEKEVKTSQICKIFNWRSNESVRIIPEKEAKKMSKLFDYAVGNPPYQDQNLGNNAGFAPPVYDKFIDAASEIATSVELIHPARFLFNAGSTPKTWNEKMLNDEHFKVLLYESDATKFFPNTDIKGGVAITYRDERYNYGKIGVFTPYPEVNSILHKIMPFLEKGSVEDIGISGYAYHFTEQLHIDNPEIKKQTIMIKGKQAPLLSKGHEYDLKSNIISKMPSVFLTQKPDNEHEYIIIVGRVNNERVNRYIRADYVNNVTNLYNYKVFIPKASGIGAFGETLGPSIIAEPGMGHTETFFSIGNFDSKIEAENLLKYLKGKFSRTLLSILKITQNITPGNFKYIPLQDFTSNSDINWKGSLSEIDKQLYHKYHLDEKEIDFIERNVKEML